MMLAAGFNEIPEVARVLLAAGANLEARDTIGATPLMRAASFNENPEVVRVLLAAGADLEARDTEGWTPLMHAAGRNEIPEVVLVLLGVGADLEARDTDGLTPLMLAAGRNENPEVVRVLLAAGANPRATSSSGERTIDFARRNEHLRDTDVYWRLHDASFTALASAPSPWKVAVGFAEMFDAVMYDCASVFEPEDEPACFVTDVDSVTVRTRFNEVVNATDPDHALWFGPWVPLPQEERLFGSAIARAVQVAYGGVHLIVISTIAPNEQREMREWIGDQHDLSTPLTTVSIFWLER